MGRRNYQICENCIIDTSDSTLQFDARGCSEYCNDFQLNIKPN